MDYKLIDLSQKLLLKVKLEQETSNIEEKLAQIPYKNFTTEIFNDERKKVFWINIYNAFYQILRKEKNYKKPEIYKKRLFTITGIKLSLDEVEHGILRKNKHKYSLGFLPNPLSSKFIKENTVQLLDYRIHFALNCGAKSCPPIAFYNVEKIEDQLNLATQSFLESETIFNHEKKELTTTALFKWFYADFGQTKGIKSIFKNQLNKDITDYKIIYYDYSWEEHLGNFVI